MIIYHENIFSSSQCNELIENMKSRTKPWRQTPRKVISTTPVMSEEFPWFYKTLYSLIKKTNGSYNMDINGLTDVPAFVNYSEGSYFDWHSDLYTGRPDTFRKFSLITILSKPKTFLGGELQFFDHGIKNYKQPVEGTVITFPAWMQHRVTEIIKGNRYSIVSFVGGPSKYR